VGSHHERDAVVGCHPSRQCQSMPGPLAVLGEVAEAVAAQTTSWQPVNRYLVRVGKTVEASTAKLRGYLLGL
jgi:hypothetical protein